MNNKFLKPVIYGIFAAAALLGLYFGLITTISGWSFTKSQFEQFWYFVISLAFGFGLQIALFTYLKNAVHNQRGTGKVLAVSGTTSTVAMISCCAHYLVNLVPVIGVTGLVSFVAKYQVELFWTGILSNFLGILFISRRIYKFNYANV